MKCGSRRWCLTASRATGNVGHQVADFNRDLPLAEQVVSNINRWRGQLSLPPIEEDDLDHQTEKLTLNGFVAYWINIVGRPQAQARGSMAQPPHPPLDLKSLR